LSSLRYPGILSASEPGGGTTDWAVHIFKQAVLYGKYQGCFLSADTALPMMYMPDCLKATIELMDAPDDLHWRSRVYNVTSMSLAPRHLEEEIRKFIPDFEIVYAPPGDFRQGIANSWPRSIDDQLAREDWGWKADFGVEVRNHSRCLCIAHRFCAQAMTRDMLKLWKSRLSKAGKNTVALRNV
jgi:threonine 3-dehydrogenase